MPHKTKYTDAMVAELEKASPHNRASASLYAKKYKLHIKSVVSKIHHLQLPYTPEPKKQKDEAKMTKADLVKQIQDRIGTSAGNTKTLMRNNYETLLSLYNNLK